MESSDIKVNLEKNTLQKIQNGEDNQQLMDIILKNKKLFKSIRKCKVLVPKLNDPKFYMRKSMKGSTRLKRLENGGKGRPRKKINRYSPHKSNIVRSPPIFIRLPHLDKTNKLSSRIHSSKERLKQTYLIRKFGRRYFNCHVKLRYLNDSNARYNKKNKKNVSFVETVEVFGYSDMEDGETGHNKSDQSIEIDDEDTDELNLNVQIDKENLPDESHDKPLVGDSNDTPDHKVAEEDNVVLEKSDIIHEICDETSDKSMLHEDSEIFAEIISVDWKVSEDNEICKIDDNLETIKSLSTSPNLEINDNINIDDVAKNLEDKDDKDHQSEEISDGKIIDLETTNIKDQLPEPLCVEEIDSSDDDNTNKQNSNINERLDNNIPDCLESDENNPKGIIDISEDEHTDLNTKQNVVVDLNTSKEGVNENEENIETSTQLEGSIPSNSKSFSLNTFFQTIKSKIISDGNKQRQHFHQLINENKDELITEG